MKNGFTLAEILITLGILGVLSAILMPTLVQNYKREAISAKLKKFYSVSNQAIKMSELRNGPKEEWKGCVGGNTAIENKMPCSDWYNIYLKDFLKTTRVEHYNSGYQYTLAYFPDGSLMVIKSGYDIFFYPYAKDYNKTDLTNVARPHNGKKCFMFTFTPNIIANTTPYTSGKGIEPYKSLVCEKINDSNGNEVEVCNNPDNEDELINNPLYGCNDSQSSKRAYCTALIQYYNWKITKNYPLKL